MDKTERVLVLFWRLYNGARISKPTFCLEMGIDARTFDRYIGVVRNFLAEIYAGQEIVFDRMDHTYLMTGATRRVLTEVEYTAIATILKGSGALGEDGMGGLLRSLGDVAGYKGRPPGEDLLGGSPGTGRMAHKRPMLKMQWDLSQCIGPGVAIRLHLIEDDGREACIAVLPKEVYYGDGELRLKATCLGTGRDVGYRVEKIRSFEILRGSAGEGYRDRP